MLTREVSAVNSTGPPPSARAPVMSFRCWGLSPSVPPVETLGKEWMACATAASEKEGERWDSAGGGGIWNSRCGGGYFCLREARVLSFLSATESSEQARRTAPLKSPPSSLEATSDANYSIWSRSLGCFWRAWGGSNSIQICSLMTLIRFHRQPPHSGARRQRLLNRKRQSQAGRLLELVTTDSITDVNFLAARSLKAQEILLMIFTEGLGGENWRWASSGWAGDPNLLGALVGGRGRLLLVVGWACEPGQRLLTGPWVRTNPVFVKAKTLLQTAHGALDHLGGDSLPPLLPALLLRPPSFVAESNIWILNWYTALVFAVNSR